MTSLLNEISALWNHFVDPPRELTLTELAELDMPDPLRVRIVATVQHQARTATIQADSEWLDMNHPNVYINWMNFVTDHLTYAKIPQAYVRTVLDSALEDLVECCVHPRTAIVDLCFGERSERSFAEVELASRAIPVHEDLVQAMIAAVEASGADAGDPAKQSGQMVQKNDAQAAIERADQALFKGVTGAELASLIVQRLAPLFELCKDSVDPTFLSTFVEEKGFDELAHQIEQYHEPFSKDEVIQLFTEWNDEEARQENEPNLQRQDASVSPEQVDSVDRADDSYPVHPSDTEDTIDTQGESAPNHPATQPNQTNSQSESVPLWMQYLQEIPEEKVEPDNEAVDAIDTTIESTLTAADSPPTHAEKLLEYLKPIQHKIMKTLFQDEYGEYLDMIQSICELSDWETTSEWLDEYIFVPQDVDLENETVIAFLDLMQAYFE
ncbi:MAG: hypothetical protein CBC65_002345 [Rhodothermaceae bacterium TMED105]|nr:MAG: hypothetical protein CBC65_002345 [Rhodothermaceae bacterium TMED105]